MKRCMLMSAVSLLFSLLLPVTVQHAAGISDAAPPEAETETEAAALPESSVRFGSDALTSVTLRRGGTVETLSMAEYLPGVVL